MVSSPLIIEAYSDGAVKNIDVSGNLMERCYNGINISMYYPRHFFYYCNVPMPAMSNNLCVPLKYNPFFADIRYDVEVGPYYPAYMTEADYIIKNVYGDITNVVK